MAFAEQLLARAFVGLADTLVDDYDIIDLLDRLVGYSVELLAADAAGLLLADSQRILRVVASSDEDAELMELMQLEADEGPGVECFHTGAPVSVADLADVASRWPAFVAAVAQRVAFRSVHALPLRLRGEAIGAMNLFHHHPGPLPEADLALGQALADVATIGILPERAIRSGEVLIEQLQTALNSRVIIEQPKASAPSAVAWACTPRSTGCAATPATATRRCPRWPAGSSRPTWPPTCSPHPPRATPPAASGDTTATQSGVRCPMTDRYPGRVAPDPGDVQSRLPGGLIVMTRPAHTRSPVIGEISDPITPDDLSGSPGRCSCSTESLRTTVGDLLVLRVAGEIDLCTLPTLQRALEDSLGRRPAHLIVDLARTTFCSVRGLEMLTRTGHTAAQEATGYAVTGVPPRLNRVWVLGWDGELPVRYRSIVVAVAAIRAHHTHR